MAFVIFLIVEENGKLSGSKSAEFARRSIDDLGKIEQAYEMGTNRETQW